MQFLYYAIFVNKNKTINMMNGFGHSSWLRMPNSMSENVTQIAEQVANDSENDR